MIADVVCGREAVYVGRHVNARVQLSDGRVAERQAVIFPDSGDVWTLKQLSPELEIRLNGAHVNEIAELSSGDEITLADYVIRVYPEFAEEKALRFEVATSGQSLQRFAKSQLPAGTILKKCDEAVNLLPTQVHRIGMMNASLGRCELSEELMDVALQTLISVFAAHRAWIGVRRYTYGPMEFVEGRTLTGSTCELPDIGEHIKPRAVDRAQFVMIPMVSPEERVSVLAGPLLGPEGPLGMVYVDSGESGRRFETPDLDYFIAVANGLAAQLHAIHQHIAKNRSATIDGEVSVAHEIQARITPRKLPQWDELQFGAFRETGLEKTGDVYDLVRLANGMAAFMVAHTTAQGALPSMLMAQAQSSFRIAAMHQDAPHILMRSLNWLLFDGQKDHPLNCFACAIDPKNGNLRYSLAGETGAYIISARGEERSLAPREPIPSLGSTRNANYPLLSEKLDNGETMAIFTPGVITAKNGAGETFGHDRFVNLLCDGFGQGASNMLKEMLSDLRSFTEGGAQPEDITVLLAHRP